MRDLQSLCDRLGEMFEGDGITPDAISVEAREAIEELWEERDQLRSAAELLATNFETYGSAIKVLVPMALLEKLQKALSSEVSGE